MIVIAAQIEPGHVRHRPPVTRLDDEGPRIAGDIQVDATRFEREQTHGFARPEPDLRIGVQHDAGAVIEHQAALFANACPVHASLRLLPSDRQPRGQDDSDAPGHDGPARQSLRRGRAAWIVAKAADGVPDGGAVIEGEGMGRISIQPGAKCRFVLGGSVVGV